MQVLLTMADGLRCKEAAARLSISEGTLKKHRSRVLHVLGARNAIEAVTIGRARGLIPGQSSGGLDWRQLLTRREVEVARHLVKGLSSKQIGRQLGTSDLTIRKHRENLLRKLGLRHTGQLVGLLGEDKEG